MCLVSNISKDVVFQARGGAKIFVVKFGRIQIFGHDYIRRRFEQEVATMNSENGYVERVKVGGGAPKMIRRSLRKILGAAVAAE